MIAGAGFSQTEVAGRLSDRAVSLLTGINWNNGGRAGRGSAHDSGLNSPQGRGEEKKGGTVSDHNQTPVSGLKRDERRMTAVIICGGLGTRAYPLTRDSPKALIEVAGRPLIRHVMDLFATYGVERFVLAAGHRARLLHAWARSTPRDWSVEVVDTDVSAGTGTRLAACLDIVGETFFATYTDGIANINLRDLLALHRQNGRGGTITVVPMPVQYGVVEIKDDAVIEFSEKPVLDDLWINAGYFAFDRTLFARYFADDLERSVLPQMAAAGELSVYRHRGFWRSVDTVKDQVEVDALLRNDDRPTFAEGGGSCHGRPG